MLKKICACVLYSFFWCYGIEKSRGNGAQDVPIQGTIGVITLNHNFTGKKAIKILNEDGRIWVSFKFYTNQPKLPKSFSPVAFDYEYTFLVLKCLRIENGKYVVLVNNKKDSLVKYVSIEDSTFIFQTWEQHILSGEQLELHERKHTIRQKPDEASKKIRISFPPASGFIPVEIQGDWLKVKWYDSENDVKKIKWSYGWVKWRDQEHILIDKYYKD
jgi:hypothetical protein